MKRGPITKLAAAAATAALAFGAVACEIDEDGTMDDGIDDGMDDLDG